MSAQSSVTTPFGLEYTVTPDLFGGVTVTITGFTPEHIETLLGTVEAAAVNAPNGSADRRTLTPLAGLFDAVHGEMGGLTG